MNNDLVCDLDFLRGNTKSNSSSSSSKIIINGYYVYTIFQYRDVFLDYSIKLGLINFLLKITQRDYILPSLIYLI